LGGFVMASIISSGWGWGGFMVVVFSVFKDSIFRVFMGCLSLLLVGVECGFVI
jgi:hypothetical protein